MWREYRQQTNEQLEANGAGRGQRLMGNLKITGMHAEDILYKIAGFTQHSDSLAAGIGAGLLATRLTNNQLIPWAVGVGTVAVNEGLKRVDDDTLQAIRNLTSFGLSSYASAGLFSQGKFTGLEKTVYPLGIGALVSTVAEGSRYLRGFFGVKTGGTEEALVPQPENR